MAKWQRCPSAAGPPRTRTHALGRPGLRLTGRVPADVAEVLLGDALLQQPHAHAVLPAQALLTLQGQNTGAESRLALPGEAPPPPPPLPCAAHTSGLTPREDPNADLG